MLTITTDQDSNLVVAVTDYPSLCQELRCHDDQKIWQKLLSKTEHKYDSGYLTIIKDNKTYKVNARQALMKMHARLGFRLKPKDKE